MLANDCNLADLPYRYAPMAHTSVVRSGSQLVCPWVTCYSNHEAWSFGTVRLQELFKEKHYKDLDGGILEGFGRLLKFDLRIYVYPTLDPKTGQVVTAENVKVCS